MKARPLSWYDAFDLCRSTQSKTRYRLNRMFYLALTTPRRYRCPGTGHGRYGFLGCRCDGGGKVPGVALVYRLGSRRVRVLWTPRATYVQRPHLNPKAVRYVAGRIHNKRLTGMAHYWVPTVPILEAPTSRLHYTPGGGEIQHKLVELVPNLEANVDCPVCGAGRPLYKIIVELNDSHCWSREQIADWTDTLDLDLRVQVPTPKRG